MKKVIATLLVVAMLLPGTTVFANERQTETKKRPEVTRKIEINKIGQKLEDAKYKSEKSNTAKDSKAQFKAKQAEIKANGVVINKLRKSINTKREAIKISAYQLVKLVAVNPEAFPTEILNDIKTKLADVKIAVDNLNDSTEAYKSDWKAAKIDKEEADKDTTVEKTNGAITAFANIISRQKQRIAVLTELDAKLTILLDTLNNAIDAIKNAPAPTPTTTPAPVNTDNSTTPAPTTGSTTTTTPTPTTDTTTTPAPSTDISPTPETTTTAGN